MDSTDSTSTDVAAVAATLAVVATLVVGASGAVVDGAALATNLDGTGDAVGHDTDVDCIERAAAILPDDDEQEDEEAEDGEDEEEEEDEDGEDEEEEEEEDEEEEEEEDEEEDEDEEEEEDDEGDEKATVTTDDDCEESELTTTVSEPEPPATRTMEETTAQTTQTTEPPTATTEPRTEPTETSGETPQDPVETTGVTLDVPSGSIGTSTTASGEASFDVTDAWLPVSSVQSGSAVFVVGTVENRGDGAGEFTAELVVDGEVRETQAVSLAAGEFETVRFRVVLSEADTYDVAVNDERAGSLSVTEAAASTARTDAIAVTEASVRADWVKSGHETVVTAVVRNDADRAVTHTVSVTVDGAVVARQTVELDPGERRSVEVPFEAVGGAVAVDDVPAGELEVSDRYGTVAETSAAGNDDGGPDVDPDGFRFAIVLVGAVGLAFAAGIAVVGRRND